eukprot:m.245426 g.245426  ORF g.245426 m.245426 type:complete len:651 (-) comp15365_c1_seq27:208-2160(-)
MSFQQADSSRVQAGEYTQLPTREQYVYEFQCMVSDLLETNEAAHLQHALTEFRTFRSINQLVANLSVIFNTPAKRDILRPLRFLIPEKNGLRQAYDKMVPYHRMAHPITQQELMVFGASRSLTIQRSQHETFGLNIRGGHDMDTGVFISSVTPQSPAALANLYVGDEVIACNGVPFEGVTHKRAAEIISSSTVLRLIVRYVGHVPVARREQSTVRWKETQAQQATSREEQELSPTQSTKHARISKELGRLGFGIRGGADYNLPIIISSVDAGGQAQQTGLMVGDEILDVNGTPFKPMTHAAAVDYLRSHDVLIITAIATGKVPVHSLNHSRVAWERAPDQAVQRQQSMMTSTPVRGTTAPVQQQQLVTPTTRARGFGVRVQLADDLRRILPQESVRAIMSAIAAYESYATEVNAVAETLLSCLSQPIHYFAVDDVRIAIRFEDMQSFDAMVQQEEKRGLAQYKAQVTGSVAKDEGTQDESGLHREQGDQATSDSSSPGHADSGAGAHTSASTSKVEDDPNHPDYSVPWYGDNGTVTVDVVKEGGKLGLGIIGGIDTKFADAGVRITHVTQDGCAKSQSDLLVRGAKILRVGSCAVDACTHAEVAMLLREQFTNHAPIFKLLLAASDVLDFPAVTDLSLPVHSAALTSTQL